MEQYPITLSLEPTIELINNLPAEARKGTELEFVLMQQKDLTNLYVKKQIDIRQRTLEEINTKLSIAENGDDWDEDQNIRSKKKLSKNSSNKSGRKVKTSHS